MKPFPHWWQKQDKQQRYRLQAAAALIALLLCASLYPYSVRWRDDARQTLLIEQRALQQMPNLEQALSQLRITPQEAINGCASPHACAQAHRLSIKLKEEHGVTVLIEPARVSFNDLVAWLYELERRFQLYATQLKITQHSSYILLEQMELRYAK